ncbi:MAG: (d)CMP kinase [Thermodesulfobacteriota bacterium]
MIRDLVTIDGPAGSGKSSVSRSVAGQLGFTYLDTGAMYRAVAFEARRRGLDTEDAAALEDLCGGLDLEFEPNDEITRLYLGGEEITDAIRTPAMDMLSSAVSAVPEVRKAMTGLQRRLAAAGRIVAEGRDMGTVVFPDAMHKFFLTASKEVRATRRYSERINRGEMVSLSRVMEELEQRDRQDESRTVAPLRPAGDAKVIDTTDMTLEQVVSTILLAVRAGG